MIPERAHKLRKEDTSRLPVSNQHIPFNVYTPGHSDPLSLNTQPKPSGEVDLRSALLLSLRLDASPINPFLAAHSMSERPAFLRFGHMNLGSVTRQRHNMGKYLQCNMK